MEDQIDNLLLVVLKVEIYFPLLLLLFNNWKIDIFCVEGIDVEKVWFLFYLFLVSKWIASKNIIIFRHFLYFWQEYYFRIVILWGLNRCLRGSLRV